MFGVFPRTSCSLGDIDQAVAVGIGVLKLLLCARGIVQDIRISVNDSLKRERDQWEALPKDVKRILKHLLIERDRAAVRSYRIDAGLL
jgi:hypothetical protein